MTRRRAPALILALALAAALGSGCAAHRRDMGEIGATRIEVDPEGELPPRFWDSFELMQRAGAAFDEGRWADALADYRTVIEKFPEIRAYPLALFNAAECLMKLGRHDEALTLYDRLERMPGPPFALTLLLDRRALCLENAKRWNEAEAVLRRLTGLMALTEVERIDAWIRLGIVLCEQGRWVEAKDALRMGLNRYNELTKRHLNVDARYVSKGYFYLGDLYLRQYEQIALTGDDAQLKDRLQTKADLLVLARAQYLRCIQTYDLWWITASLHQLGYGYETFYFGVMEAPLPDDLTEEQKDVYVRKLESRLSLVIKKAVDAYERNVDLDERNRLHSPWSEKSLERLGRLQEYLRTHQP